MELQQSSSNSNNLKKIKQIDFYSVFIECLVSKFRTHFYFGCSIICQRLDKIHLTIHSTFSNTHGPHVLAQSASQSPRTKSRHVLVDQNVPMDGVDVAFFANHLSN